VNTSRGRAIIEILRSAFVEIDGLSKTSPGEAEEIVRMLVSDLRSRRPVAVCELGRLPPPGERIRDPRGGTT